MVLWGRGGSEGKEFDALVDAAEVELGDGCWRGQEGLDAVSSFGAGVGRTWEVGAVDVDADVGVNEGGKWQ